MKISGTKHVSINIEPLEVINKLIEDTVPHRDWFYEYTYKKKTKYYHMTEGYHNSEHIVREITKDEYEYLENLKKCKKYLESKK